MPITSLTDLTDAQKEDLVISLSALVLGSAGGAEEASGEKLQAIAKASGNEVSDSLAALFASVLTKAGGIDSFCGAPGSGGGGGGGGGGGAAEAAQEEEKEEEPEEEEMDLGGGMDMFGGDAGDGDY
eukprot:CAMPEP_0118693828 /NCGR_PEP_ID=MMETSP0800-20121206/12142_1 /TAXON_ID=210618 ORGANISM="Striatella unipunctata, Strain CCMP2910" /NCGR_SAMPLE_ID=MMETSP0800 /ASSEMBLY_ACC=CAM_ASM_000638 /LENGTH=126 /DNA_ID=CAMNT_0006592141 /DNA_START=174 /DNA_END=554 /DNA_ORIENTATION=+